MSEQSRTLTLLEAAAYLNVSERWMRDKVHRRLIPHWKAGNLLRFELADLEAYKAERKVEVLT